MAYTWEADSTTATTTYILKDGDTELAKITGLKANLITGSDPVENLTDVEISGESGSEVITVAAGALDDTSKTSGVSLTGSGYTLKINDTKYGATISSEAVTVSNGTATLTGTLSAGWKKAASGESYTYTAEATGQTLATVTGLGDGATASGTGANVSYAEKKITLKKDALGKESTGMQFTLATGITGYSLALYGANQEGKVGFEDHNAWELAGAGNAKYCTGKEEGWTLDTSTNKVTYTAADITDVVTISGLSDDIKVNEGKLGTSTNGAFVEGVTFGNTEETKTQITLKEAVLGKSETKNITVTGTDYTLKLDGSITKISATLTEPKLDFTGSTPTVTGTVEEYWTVAGDSKSISYKAKTTPTLATITGLGSAASTTGNVTAAFASDILTVTVKEAALGTSTVTLTPRTAEQVGITTFDAEFALVDANDTALTKVGLEDGAKYWAYQGTTAYYRYDTTAGFTFDKSNKPLEITYTAAKTGNNATTLATITNLTTNLSSLYNEAEPEETDNNGNVTKEAKTASITGITVATEKTGDNYAITLNKDVLGTDKNNATTLDGTGYILALATGVPNEAKTDVKVWTFGTNNATLTSSNPAYWTIETGDTPKTITYTAESEQKNLATVTGLNTLTGDALTHNITVTDPETSGDSAVTTPGTIALGKDALGTKNVTLTNGVDGNFKLALITGNDYAATALNPTEVAWTINGTTATYSGKVTAASYEATTDGSQIIYTAAGDSVTLATIKGLKSGLTTASADTYFKFGNVDSGTGAFSKATGGKVIQIAADALGASNVSVTGTNYTLALPATGVKTGTYTAATADTPATTTYSTTENVWRLTNSTTAVYKKVTPAYYTLDESNNTSIIYTAEADVELTKTESGTTTKVADSTIYATVSGLKSGVVEENGQIGTNTGASGAFVQGITLGKVDTNFSADNTGTVLQMSKAVLGTGEITVAKGDAAASDYTFVLIDSENPGQQEATNPSDKTWTGGNGTFKYVGSLTEGWELATTGTDANKKITYAAAESAHEFATVEGLSSDVTAAALNDASTGSNYLTVDSVDNVITLKAKALGGKDISVTGNDGYTLALDSTGINTDNTQKNIWAVATDGTTYTYKTVEQDFYAYAKDSTDSTKDDKTKIKYTAQKDKSTIATFAGLKSGLLNETTGAMTGITVVDNDTKKFTVTTDALDEKDVTISNLNTNYLVEGNFGTDNLKPGTAYWDLDGTTAKYQHDVTAGYTYDNTAKKITYAPETTVVEAEIAGLKSGLKVSNGAIEGITVDGTAFKLDASEVLTTTDATLKNNKKADNTDYTYTLALDNYTKPANGTAWVVKGTTAVLVNYAPEFYAVTTEGTNQNKEIVYTPAKVGSSNYSSVTTTTIPSGQTLATVTGLKSGLKPDANGQIAGLTVAGTTITLDKRALGTTNVAVAVPENSTAYTLDLTTSTDTNIKVDAPTESHEWSVKNGVPTYTSTTAAGYKLDESTGTGDDASPTKGQIVYSPQKVIKVTVNGLDTVAANTAGDKVGKKSGDNYYGIRSSFTVNQNEITGATESLTGTLTLGKDVLNKKNVTVSTSGGTANVTFELDTGVAATTSAAVWNKAKGKTVATYTETTAAGYSLPTDNKKVIYSSKATTKTLATVTGLKKDLVPTNGELTGVTILPPVEEVKDGEGNVTTAAEPAKIQLSKEVLNTSDITLGKNDNYELALAGTYASTAANVNQVWTYNKSKGTATVRVGTTEGWAIKTTEQTKADGSKETVNDPKTIVYTTAKLTNVATVSGLAKDLTLTDGHIEGLDVTVAKNTTSTSSGNVAETGSSAEAETPDKYTGTISITNSVLNSATVKVEVPKAQQSKYSFEFSYDVNDIKAPTDSTNYWRGTGNGTVTYQFDTSAGYTPNDANDPTVLTYSKAKTTVHATLSGLDKKVGAYNTVATKDSKGKPLTYSDPAELPGIEVTLATAAVADDPNTAGVNEATEAVPGTITLKASVVDITPTAVTGNFTNKVTLKKGTVGDYNLNIDEIDVEEAGAKWTASGTTATYKDYDAAGYTLAANKKTATFVKETAKATLATVKGIKKLDAAAATDFNENPATYVSVEGDKITLTSKAVGTSTISLTQGKDRDKKVTTYYFDTNVSTRINPRDAQTPYWTFSKGTATLKQLTKDGYTPNDDTKPTKFVYSKNTTATLATVKNLSTNLAIATEDNIPTGGSQVQGKIYATTTVKSGNTTTTTITGTNVALEYDATAKTITLNKDAFNKKTVTVTVPKNSDQYTLKLGTDLGEFANYTRNTTGWTVSGTTATYRNYDQLFYTPATDGKSIVYTAETKGTTYATVTGLKEGVTADDFTASGVWTPDATNNASNANPAGGGVLTLDGRHLGTSTVKITTNLTNTKNKDSFALALSTTATGDNAFKASMLNVTGSSVTADKSGKAIIKGKQSEGFAVDFGGKQITYTNANAATKDVTVATVTGLAKEASISFNSSTGQITLDSNDLTTKNVSVVTSKGNTTYTLNYTDTAPGTNADSTYAPTTSSASEPFNPSKKTPGWTISKNTGTLKGYVTSEGYKASESGTSLTYTAKTLVNEKTDKEGNKTYTYKDTATLATIKGLNDSAGLDAPTSDGKISLSKNDIKGSSVTINGGTFAVEIDSSYKDKTINGSAGADNITAQGTGLTINTGKGDDNITLGTTSRTKGNTLVYSTGDGNDVVANFDVSKDKLQIKKGTATVEKVDNDFIVRVGTGSIKLTGAAASSATELTIINNKGTEVTYSSIPETRTGGSPLLVDDNYFTDPTQLSEIVKPFEASFTPYEFKTNFNLTKEESFVPTATYTNKK